jgi:hypothetical protein
MRIARPPGGFTITMSPNVRALIEQRCAASAPFARHWEDIVDRLRFTAHVEGVEDNRFQKGSRLWSAAADEERGLPRVMLLYRVVGSVVRIGVASIG